MESGTAALGGGERGQKADVGPCEAFVTAKRAYRALAGAWRSLRKRTLSQEAKLTTTSSAGGRNGRSEREPLRPGELVKLVVTAPD